MATQFAINEPDSSNSPNAPYLQLRGSRAQGFRLLHSPDDVVFGYGAIDFIGDHDYFDIPLPANIIDSFLIFSRACGGSATRATTRLPAAATQTTCSGAAATIT